MVLETTLLVVLVTNYFDLRIAALRYTDKHTIRRMAVASSNVFVDEQNIISCPPPPFHTVFYNLYYDI